MAKSRSQTYRRLCVIARDILVAHPALAESDLTELVKTAMSRAHLPYTTETVWNALSAVKHSMRRSRQTGSNPFPPTSHETF